MKPKFSFRISVKVHELVRQAALEIDLKVQTCSKLDETCLLVTSTEITPTHSEVLKGVGRKHVTVLLPIRDLKRFWRDQNNTRFNLVVIVLST